MSVCESTIDSFIALAFGAGVAYSSGYAPLVSNRIFCNFSSASSNGIVFIQAIFRFRISDFGFWSRSYLKNTSVYLLSLISLCAVGRLGGRVKDFTLEKPSRKD